MSSRSSTASCTRKSPSRATPGHNATRNAAEYGYRSGVVLGSPGHLRVRISPPQAMVEYVRSYLPADDERADRCNGAVAHAYTLEAAPRRAR